MPFLQIAPAFTSRNNKSALDHSEFVNDAILELLNTARVMELYKPPHVVNPLSVSIQPNGKKRLILDLRYINNFLTLSVKSSTKIGSLPYPTSKRILL